MNRTLFKSGLFIISLMMLSTFSQATSLQRLGLADMTERSDKIFRGIVTDVEQINMQLGGAAIPVVRYRLRVAEQLKGDADVVKGDNTFIEIAMVGSIKANEPRNDGYVQFGLLRDIPRLEMGSDYVLFTTHRSRAGLSTTVGLGQGAFNVFSAEKQDMVMNQYGNANIDGASGAPMTYESLKRAITAAMTQ